MGTSVNKLAEIARRLIKSECRLYVLRNPDFPVELEKASCVRLWEEWAEALRSVDPTSDLTGWLRPVLEQVKQEAVAEVSALGPGFDLTEFEKTFSVDVMLAPGMLS